MKENMQLEMQAGAQEKKYLFTNDFVFYSVLTANEKICKDLVELLLDVKVRKIEVIRSQEEMKHSERGKGIRLDVYVEDSDAVYNLEMQTTSASKLAKRSRYYQCMIDQTLLNKGEDYDRLRKSFVVFICKTDPFGKNLSRYHFVNTCLEEPGLLLGDETETVFLNASGDRSGVSRELSEFLDYIKTAEPKGELAGEIEEEIEQVTQSPEWRKTYMTFEMKLKDIREEFYEKGREEGREEGRAEGREEGREEGISEGVIIGAKAMQMDDDWIIENLTKVCGVTEERAADILRDFYQRQK